MGEQRPNKGKQNRNIPDTLSIFLYESERWTIGKQDKKTITVEMSIAAEDRRSS